MVSALHRGCQLDPFLKGYSHSEASWYYCGLVHVPCSRSSLLALPSTMSAPEPTKLRSKQWSCSDLSRGARQVMSAKKELGTADEDVAEKIKAIVAQLLQFEIMKL